jgi:hypothetical protein
MKRIQKRFHGFALATGLALVAGAVCTSPARADTFGGRAFAAYVNAPTLGAPPMYLADSGELSPAGGWEGAGVLGVQVPGVLSASVLNSATSGGSGLAAGSSSLADLVILPGHPARLTASFVRAEVRVGSRAPWGVTLVDGLTFGGVPVQVTGLPNQRVEIPLVATLTINEQNVSPDGLSIAVNALRLALRSGDQVVLAGARSQVDPAGDVTLAGARRPGSCGGPPAGIFPAVRFGVAPGRPPVALAHVTPECFDFMTGGGWFEPRFEGGPPERVNFGFNAGYRTPGGPLKGHFNLVDHNDGTHVKGLNVDTYVPLDAPSDPCRIFQGDAEMNGARGLRYYVEACDYGEPGRDDRLRVIVFGPGGEIVYFADDSDSAKACDAGEPRCGDLDGGNIQLHKPCQQQPASAPAPRRPIGGTV